jgi:hypothetical protein
MQNRLDAAREARAASERQLAEVQAAIVAERATRPEIVRFQATRFPAGFLLTTVTYFVRGAHAHAVMTGSTHGSPGAPRGDDEGASRAADGARRVWRM